MCCGRRLCHVCFCRIDIMVIHHSSGFARCCSWSCCLCLLFSTSSVSFFSLFLLWCPVSKPSSCLSHFCCCCCCLFPSIKRLDFLCRFPVSRACRFFVAVCCLSHLEGLRFCCWLLVSILYLIISQASRLCCWFFPCRAFRSWFAAY